MRSLRFTAQTFHLKKINLNKYKAKGLGSNCITLEMIFFLAPLKLEYGHTELTQTAQIARMLKISLDDVGVVVLPLKI